MSKQTYFNRSPSDLDITSSLNITLSWRLEAQSRHYGIQACVDLVF